MSKEIYHIEATSPRTELEVNKDITFHIDSVIASDYTGNKVYVGQIDSHPQPEIAKFSVFANGSEREWNGYLIALQHNISTANPIALVTRSEQPESGLIVDYIDGPSLAMKPKDTLLYQFGTEISKLHNITLPGYGYFTKTVPQFSTATEYSSYWLDRTLPYIDNNPSVYSLFKQLHDVASQRIYSFSSSFIHKDGRFENALIDKNKVRLIDFEWWQGGDPLDDLAIVFYNILTKEMSLDMVQQIVAGYKQNTPFTDGERSSINFYLLFQSFRLIAFAERKNSANKQDIYSYLNKIIQYIDSEHLYKI